MFTRDPNSHLRPLPAPATSTRESWPATFRHTPLRLTYFQVSYTWLVCSLDHKHKGKGMWLDCGEERFATTLKKRLCSRLTTAKIWPKKKFFCVSQKHFFKSSLDQTDKFFALFWCLFVSISFILLLFQSIPDQYSGVKNEKMCPFLLPRIVSLTSPQVFSEERLPYHGVAYGFTTIFALN